MLRPAYRQNKFNSAIYEKTRGTALDRYEQLAFIPASDGMPYCIELEAPTDGSYDDADNWGCVIAPRTLRDILQPPAIFIHAEFRPGDLLLLFS